MNTLLWWLAQNTITVAVMIPFVLLACRLFRNRPAVQHVFWAVVLLKFVTRPIVLWPWTVEQLRDSIAAATEPTTKGTQELPTPDMTVAKGTEGDEAFELIPSPLQKAFGGAGAAGPAPVLPAHEGADLVGIAIHLTVLLWLVGAAVCLLRLVRRIAGHAALVRRGAEAPRPLLDAIAAVAKHFYITPPRTLVARGILSPFLWCLGRLRLVWPESLSSEADVARSRGVIAHELAHVRRGDHWLTWLELVVGIVWWWNPLCWFVRRRLRETAEMACDALAIGTHPESRREYAEMLLGLSAGFKTGAPTPVLAVSAGARPSFERRLSMILSDKVTGKMSWCGILAALALVLIALPSWSQGQSPRTGAIAAGHKKLQERQTTLGADHPDTLQARNDLAEAYRAFGELEKAIGLHEQALALRTAKFGADHQQTLQSIINLAATYMAANQPEKARAVLERTGAGRAKGAATPKTRLPSSPTSGAFPATKSHDGKILAVADKAGEVLLVERSTGQSLGRVQLGAIEKIVGLVFTPDNKLLRLHSDQAKVWEIDVATRKILRMSEGKQSPSRDIAGSPSPKTPDRVRLIRLKYSKVREVETTLSKIFKDVQISFDVRTNSILLRGPADRVEQTEEMIRKLDSQDDPTTALPMTPPATPASTPKALSEDDPVSGKRAFQELLHQLHAPADPTNPKKPVGKPSSATDPGSIDLVNLARQMIDARAVVQLAQTRLARLKPAGPAIATDEFLTAQIQLDAAQRKLNLLTMVAKAAMDSAKSELDMAQDRAAWSNRMLAKGYIAQSQQQQAAGQVAAAQSKIKAIESMLNPNAAAAP